MKCRSRISENTDASRIVSFFASSFIIAITNPATILTFMLAFSVFEVETVKTAGQGIRLAVGIFSGACLWWFFIVAVVRLFKKCATDIWQYRINRILGALIIVFGVVVMLRAVI